MARQPHDEESDMTLIRSYLHGSEQAFALLYARYRQRLIAYLNRLLQPDFAAADDIFQLVWLRVIQSLPSYSDRERFISWLFRIAHNLTIDHIRQRQRQKTVTLYDSDLPETPDEKNDFTLMDDPDLHQQITDALEQLSPEQREVVILRRDGVSFKEIAVIQSTPLNTAIGRMHDALRNIRKILALSPRSPL